MRSYPIRVSGHLSQTFRMEAVPDPCLFLPRCETAHILHGMKQTDDFLTRVTKVCPPDFNFNIGNKIEPIIFINGSFRNLVADTECKLFIELLTGNGFPVTAYINSFRYLPEQDHLQEQSVVFYLQGASQHSAQE